VVRNAFGTDPQAEQAEIARLVESLARPPGEDIANTSASPHDALDMMFPVAGRCCRESPAVYHGGEVKPPGEGPYAGLLTNSEGAFLQVCNADRILELVDLSEDALELPRVSKITSIDQNRDHPRKLSRAQQQNGEDLYDHDLKLEPSEGAWQIARGACIQQAHRYKDVSPAWSRIAGEAEPIGVSWMTGHSIFVAKSTSVCDNGSHLCTNGSTCVGQWNGNILDGYGIERWPDGSVFVGDFSAGQKHGAGRLAWVNGSTYDGEFELDCMHGEGLYVWSDGRGYSGQWTRNCPGPSGTIRWSDGRTYTGEFAEGRMHGYGEFQWPDGRRFAGQWCTGCRHGTGVMSNIQGVARQCVWHRGDFVRWTSNHESAAEDEPSGSSEMHDEKLEFLGSTRRSPRDGLSRDVGGDVLLLDGESDQLIAERCSLGKCETKGFVIAL
jgi:hypothetical protein